MRKNRRLLVVSGFVMALVAILALGCSTSTQSGELIPSEVAKQVDDLRDAGSAEHREGGEHAGEQSESAGHREGPGRGEESGQLLALDDVYDTVRNGARLKMVYDPETTSFKGIVVNTTGQPLCRVRVEVHLSSGAELGPTTPNDLPSERGLMVELSAAGETFDRWSAHAEMPPCAGGGGGEHGEGGEHGGDSD